MEQRTFSAYRKQTVKCNRIKNYEQYRILIMSSNLNCTVRHYSNPVIFDGNYLNSCYLILGTSCDDIFSASASARILLLLLLLSHYIEN